MLDDDNFVMGEFVAAFVFGEESDVTGTFDEGKIVAIGAEG